MIHPIILQLKHKRLEMDLRQRDLADRIRVSEKTLSTWETGEHGPQFESLLDWTNALRMDLKLKSRDPTDFEERVSE